MEICPSVRNEFQCKTNIFHGFNSTVQLAGLQYKTLPHFHYRKPPGTLVRRTTRVTKSCSRGAPTPTQGGQNLIDITNYRLRFINVPDEEEFFILRLFFIFCKSPFCGR